MNDSIDSIEKLIAPQINVASLMASTTAPPRRKLSLDNRSLVSEGTTRLFKYGHEVPPEYSLSKSKTLPTSLSSQCSSASTESLNMNLPLDSLLPRDRPLSSKPQNLRVVSGAQFRLLHKGNQLKSCEQCEQFDRIHRKDKETIRALKLQINRIQSHYEDLKYTRNTDGVASSSSLNQNSKISPASSSPMPESAAISDDSDLSRKLQQVEDELGKIKRLLAFERSSGDALRQNMEEQKRAFASELQRVEQEGDKLRSELSVLRLQNAKLRSENDSLSVKYSDSERELQLCQRRLNDALL